ncbi:hypothetical protein [Janthinobacterium sp. 17J80-10]|uniref:hypothetical protein n=1 Tax=Janthinobacterium sp. 17J80-10 TaxID=2497863 RepID=UPI001005370E|nr:hypothetical protein [Janthinobacterium sp. 17J80-10]QAU33754.1 hypothetical protein EKL02_05905 [Janthinobacterium sp. 17J80-10]
MSLSLAKEVEDSEWGCTYQAVTNGTGNPNIKLCHVKVKNLNEFAARITTLVLDNSWMTKLDYGTRRAYDRTVSETANALVNTFRQTAADGTVGAEFGEVMVSIGSAHALEQIFEHIAIPIAELWKPQVKQNEGFDFHTVCTSEYINFGEAKYSNASSPHGLAIRQADDFLQAEKHLRDRNHLEKLVEESSIQHLDQDNFGVVAAFSINAKQPLVVFENALKSASKIVASKRLTNFYLVGVTEEC